MVWITWAALWVCAHGALAPASAAMLRALMPTADVRCPLMMRDVPAVVTSAALEAPARTVAVSGTMAASATTRIPSEWRTARHVPLCGVWPGAAVALIALPPRR